jgi:hypothetical protein
MQTLEIIRGNTGKYREADAFCSWIEVQVMTDLIEALPNDKQNQVIDQFMTLPDHKKEGIFYPYYTKEFMRQKLKNAQEAISPRGCLSCGYKFSRWKRMSLTLRKEYKKEDAA